MPAMFLINRSSIAFVAATTLLGVALLSSAPAAQAQSSYTETFNGAVNGSGEPLNAAGNPTFTDQSGTWTVANPGASGTYGSSVAGASQFYFSTFNDNAFAGATSLTNASISFDLRNASDSGAVLRWDAGKNGIVAIVRTRNTGSGANNGRELFFAQVSNGTVFGQYGTVALATSGANAVVSGGNYRVTFSSARSGTNDFFSATVFDATGTTALATASINTAAENITAPTSGTGGLYQFNTVDALAGGVGSQFDNVTLQETPEPSTILLALPALGGVGGVALRRRRRARSK